MRPLRSASNAIGKLKQRFVNDAPSTSSSLRPLSSTMRRRSSRCSRAIAALLTNASCSATRIRFSKESCWRRVSTGVYACCHVQSDSHVGIDVQAELQHKTGSPALGPTYIPPQPAPGPLMQAPLQRTALNRQHARRAGQPFAPRMAPGSAAQSEMSFPARSPQGHPTPSSHASSPAAMSTQSPASMQPGGLTPPGSAMHSQSFAAQQQARSRYAMQHPSQRQAPAVQYANSTGMSNLSVSSAADNNGGAPAAPSAYYPSPFQKHIDQLGKWSRSLSPLIGRTLVVLG